MDEILLKKIDRHNFLEAINLKLWKSQERFVDNPVRSLAEGYVYYNECTPFGIYLDNKMIGYVMVIYNYDLHEYKIGHMVIDRNYQHNGYGKMAMEKCLDYIKTKPFGKSDKIVLTCNIENNIAIHLCDKLGFVETGRIDGEGKELLLMI